MRPTQSKLKQRFQRKAQPKLNKKEFSAGFQNSAIQDLILYILPKSPLKTYREERKDEKFQEELFYYTGAKKAREEKMLKNMFI